MSDARTFEEALQGRQTPVDEAGTYKTFRIESLREAHARELAAARLEYLKPREHGTCTFAMIGKLKCPGELCDENGNCETHAEAYKALYSDLAAARAETWREAAKMCTCKHESTFEQRATKAQKKSE